MSDVVTCDAEQQALLGVEYYTQKSRCAFPIKGVPVLLSFDQLLPADEEDRRPDDMVGVHREALEDLLDKHHDLEKKQQVRIAALRDKLGFDATRPYRVFYDLDRMIYYFSKE